MVQSGGSSPGGKMFCPLFKKEINAFQCQLYQGVEYKNAAACMSCVHRNEAVYGQSKQQKRAH
jgi:hypothetical protein